MACPAVEKLLISSAVLVGSGLVAVSRVYLHYHTVNQVLAGLAVGAVMGSLWWLVYVAALEPAGRALCASWVGQRLLIRDYSRVRNQARFEWEQLAKGQEAGGRKKVS